MPSGFQAFGSAEGYVGSPTAVADPSSLASTLGWWRADDAHDVGSSKCDSLIPKVALGDANKTAAQSNGTIRPTIIASDADFNGESSLSFAGNDLLATGIWSASVADPFWVFVVAKATGNQYLCDDIATGNRHSLFRNTNNIQGFETGSSAAAAWLGTPAAIVFCFSNASGVSYVNSHTSAPQTGVGASGNLTGLTIGNYLGGGIGGAKIADIAIGSGVPSVDTVAVLMTYAAARYGFTIS